MLNRDDIIEGLPLGDLRRRCGTGRKGIVGRRDASASAFRGPIWTPPGWSGDRQGVADRFRAEMYHNIGLADDVTPVIDNSASEPVETGKQRL